MLKEQAQKKADKRKKKKKNQAEKSKQKKEEEKQKQEQEKVEKELQSIQQAQQQRMSVMTDRERRALAAEMRVSGGSKLCDHCGKQLPLVPFERLHFKYCTTACVVAHKKKLEGTQLVMV